MKNKWVIDFWIVRLMQLTQARYPIVAEGFLRVQSFRCKNLLIWDRMLIINDHS